MQLFNRLLFPILLGCLTGSAQVTDFRVQVYGPQTLFKGYSTYLQVRGENVVGNTTETATPAIAGLPQGVTARWLLYENLCCGGQSTSLTTPISLMLVAGPTVQSGQYNIRITLATDRGVSRTVSYPLTVWATVPPVLKATTYPANTTLPTKSQWEYEMTTLGRQNCFDDSFADESHVWYYDGMRVFYQIADYTRDPSWNTCAQRQRNAYRSYVLGAKGSFGGWRVFPEGLLMDYQRTGDVLSRTAVEYMFDNGWFMHPTTSFNVLTEAVKWDLSREVSYAINVHLAHEKLGYPRSPDLQVLVEQLLGDFDQWFVSRRASYVQPFMVGLAAETLIGYYETTPDPRIPYLLKTAADWLRANSWDFGTQSFPYLDADGGMLKVTDENLLIAPLYGWVYRYTGDVNYRNWGDEAFNSGVLYGWMGSGKFFSMNFRWSAKYVEWRQSPAGSGGSTGPGTKATFLKVDAATQGSWKGSYGGEGYSLAGNATLNPSYAAPRTDASLFVWNGSTLDRRALQKASTSDRIAATWWNAASFNIDLNFGDTATHQVALYMLDWDTNGPRSQKIEVVDMTTNNILDNRTVSSFVGGQYVVWNLSGQVRIRVKALKGNAVVSGIFFDGAR